MKTQFFVSLIALLLNSSLVYPQQFDFLGEGLREYLNEVFGNLGPTLKNGIPSLDIPQLDPFVVPRTITIREAKDAIKLDGEFKELVIKGLSDIEVDGLKVVTSGHMVTGIDLNAEGTIVLDEVVVEGTYFLDGRAFAVLPIRGNGKLNLNARLIKGLIKVNVDANPLQKKLSLKSLALDLDFRQVTANFENLINEKLSTFLNQAISSLAKPVFVRLFNANMKSKIERILTEKINEKLAQVDFDKLPIG